MDSSMMSSRASMGEPEVTSGQDDGPVTTVDLLMSVLDNAEVGVIAADAGGRAMYANASARALLDSADAMLPTWLTDAIAALRTQLDRGVPAVGRVQNGELMLRVRVRRLNRPGAHLIELAIAQGSAGRAVAEQLARGLGLPITDARLLALLWRGLSNDEIADALGVRTGTIKSRLFRLYQKLGVKKRPAAVLRAQEALAS
jgi:DNA-binding CsgD family transcriptional regulator